MHSRPDVNIPVSFLSQCFTEIKKWMSENCLCLNSDKDRSDAYWFTSPVRKAESVTLGLVGSALQFQTKLKSLGVIFDANLTFDPHVRNTVKASFFSSQKHCQITSHVDVFCGQKVNQHNCVPLLGQSYIHLSRASLLFMLLCVESLVGHGYTESSVE